jgi:tetratricopeptide (TPR) repeat protein
MQISRALKSALILRSVLVGFTFCVSALIPSRVQSLEQTPPQTEAPVQAGDALNQGVQAFKNAQFDEAVRLFIRAKELDPSSLNARLYLATVYASQYIPGAPSEENTRLAKLAIDEYRDVLQIEPQNLSAIDGLASILFQRAGQPLEPEMFAESKSYLQKHIELKPQDPEPYYSVGVIDWALSYRGNILIREEFNKSVGGEGLKDLDPLPEVLRSDYVKQYGPLVDEGIDYLKHAIALKPDYDDALTYLNLLYRRKADMASTPTEREEFNKIADDLLDRVVEIKKKIMKMQEKQN